ncbi:mucin-2-like [Dreissena polymorpha]|uniref:C-type lectin domain-containing protein n=1 Tax=Dreissena polymorpha TaxID=45954 RepID=A0A9D4BN39_DREPO|nr:mucin-2-like [Dreissena polymorpha]KAH3710011.1 hypothetical protein DPMN_069477 [Dreissena polymorpha]
MRILIRLLLVCFIDNGVVALECFSCPSALKADSCSTRQLCAQGEICMLRLGQHGQTKDLYWETMCYDKKTCLDEISTNGMIVSGGRKRFSDSKFIGGVCIMQCCDEPLCNRGCNETVMQETWPPTSNYPTTASNPSTIQLIVPTTPANPVTTTTVNVIIPTKPSVTNPPTTPLAPTKPPTLTPTISPSTLETATPTTQTPAYSPSTLQTGTPTTQASTFSPSTLETATPSTQTPTFSLSTLETGTPTTIVTTVTTLVHNTSHSSTDGTTQTLSTQTHHSTNQQTTGTTSPTTTTSTTKTTTTTSTPPSATTTSPTISTTILASTSTTVIPATTTITSAATTTKGTTTQPFTASTTKTTVTPPMLSTTVQHVYMNLTCPRGLESFDTSCYAFVKHEMPFDQAVDYCMQRGAYLVQMNSQSENAFLVEHLKHTHEGPVVYWLGISDFQREGHWQYVGTSEEATFTDWAPNEPDDKHNLDGDTDTADCAVLSPNLNWKWQDSGCSIYEVGSTICELRNPSLP